MRLPQDQRNAVREEVPRLFGDDALFRSFDSRVDDNARGGDIDLHIEASGSSTELFDRGLRLQVRLLRRFGDRRIDRVVLGRDCQPRPIDDPARRTGVAL